MPKLLKYLAALLGTLAALLGFMVPVMAAELSFGAPANALNVGCKQALPIWLDTAGVPSNAVDVEVSYDANAIQIVDSIPTQTGVQIMPSKAYQTFFYNQVQNGRIKIAAGSADFSLNGKKEVGTIEFIPLFAGNTTLNFKFSGVGNTLDSNVASTETSKEILSSVKNITLTLAPAAAKCAELSVPTVEFVYPLLDQKDVSTTAQILFKINDSTSGVDLSSLVIELDGQTYTSSNSRLKITGDNNAAVFSLQPYYSDTNSARTVQLKITGKSIAGVPFTDSISFTLKAPDVANPVTIPTVTTNSSILNWIADRDQDLLPGLSFPFAITGWAKLAVIFTFLNLLLLIVLLIWHKFLLAPFKFLKVLLFKNFFASNTLVMDSQNLKVLKFAFIKAGKSVAFTDKFGRGETLLPQEATTQNLELTFPGLEKYLAPLDHVATRQVPYIFALKGKSYLNPFLWRIWKLLAAISLISALLAVLASYSLPELLLVIFITILLALFA